MHTLHHDTCRAAARSTFLTTLALGAIAIVLALGHSARAALIGVSLSYDGSVRVGATTGVEAHDQAPIFPPNPSSLPATNPPLPAPLQPAKNLNAVITEFSDFLMGMSVNHAVITINGTGGNNSAFTNPIDTTLPYPVQFDASFYSNPAPPANQMIDLKWVGLEDGSFDDVPPFPTTPDVTTSGVGTQANPWNVHIGIPANLVNVANGFVKVHLYYKFGALIPEPAAATSMLLGLLGLVLAPRRRMN